MKVKITKTIDVSQIPSETRRMLDQAKNSLLYGLPEKMGQIVMHSLSTNGAEYFYTIELLDSLRQELASFDDSLQEVQNIMKGYKEAVMPDQPETPEPEYDEEWLAQEEAKTEKRQAYTYDADEVEDEEG